jgi:hypothetical protein
MSCSLSSLSCFVLTTASIVVTSGLSTAGSYAAQLEKPGSHSAQQLLADQPSTGTVNPEAADLPEVVRNAILKDVSQRTQKQISQFRLVRTSHQTWPDRCLGIASTGAACPEAVVPGWAVLVASGKQLWVYRADESGAIVKWDEDATKTVTALRTTETTSQRRLANNPKQTTTASSATHTQQTVLRRPNSTPKVAVTQTSGTGFKDISANYWAKDFITELADKKIILGYPDGTYRPEEPVTRAELAAMLSLAFLKDKSRQPIIFQDVSTSDWTHSYILDAYQKGFLDVDAANKFNPEENISRLDIFVALARGLNYSAGGSTNTLLSGYMDASTIPDPLRTLIAAATEKGIVVSYPNVKMLNLTKQATRAEVAAILYQALVNNGQATNIASPYVAGKVR